MFVGMTFKKMRAASVCMFCAIYWWCCYIVAFDGGCYFVEVSGEGKWGLKQCLNLIMLEQVQ